MLISKKRIKEELELLKHHSNRFLLPLFVLVYLGTVVFRNLVFLRFPVEPERLRDLGHDLIKEDTSLVYISNILLDTLDYGGLIFILAATLLPYSKSNLNTTSSSSATAAGGAAEASSASDKPLLLQSSAASLDSSAISNSYASSPVKNINNNSNFLDQSRNTTYTFAPALVNESGLSMHDSADEVLEIKDGVLISPLDPERIHIVPLLRKLLEVLAIGHTLRFFTYITTSLPGSRLV